ncbi:MAG: SCO family protein [Planctomycetes bacterium]|nr:SCO family protein [Planctomycetota bacterium]
MFRSVVTAAALLATLPLTAQGAGMSPSRTIEAKEEAASMVNKIGEQIDTSLTFTDERGYPFALRQLFPGERPVILLLGYYSCPAMCGQVLGATIEALNDVDLEPGKDYQLLNVSIDPRETVQTAKDRKNAFLPKFKKIGAADGWRVCVGDEQSVKSLAEDVGFRFYWSELTNQFAHPPAVVVLSKTGVVSRVIVNTVFDGADLRLALVEASDGTLGDFWDQVRLNCLTFDPRSNTYSLTPMTILRIGGGATMLALAVMIFVLVRRERRKSPAATPAAATP